MAFAVGRFFGFFGLFSIFVVKRWLVGVMVRGVVMPKWEKWRMA